MIGLLVDHHIKLSEQSGEVFPNPVKAQQLLMEMPEAHQLARMLREQQQIAELDELSGIAGSFGVGECTRRLTCAVARVHAPRGGMATGAASRGGGRRLLHAVGRRWLRRRHWVGASQLRGRATHQARRGVAPDKRGQGRPRGDHFPSHLPCAAARAVPCEAKPCAHSSRRSCHHPTRGSHCPSPPRPPQRWATCHLERAANRARPTG